MLMARYFLCLGARAVARFFVADSSPYNHPKKSRCNFLGTPRGALNGKVEPWSEERAGCLCKGGCFDCAQHDSGKGGRSDKGILRLCSE